MSSSTAELRIRRMNAADLDRVMEIAGSLRDAPQWPASAYVEAIDPKHVPRRIALVAELGLEERASGAKAHANFEALAARLKSCPDTKPSQTPAGPSFYACGGAVKTAPVQDEGYWSESARVVGFLVAGTVAPEAELETIAVSAEVQRRGVGGLLLKELVEELRAEQVTELILEVRASNRAALGFYRARGFKESGRRPRYYADPEEDAVLMGLSLG